MQDRGVPLRPHHRDTLLFTAASSRNMKNVSIAARSLLNHCAGTKLSRTHKSRSNARTNVSSGCNQARGILRRRSPGPDKPTCGRLPNEPIAKMYQQLQHFSFTFAFSLIFWLLLAGSMDRQELVAGLLVAAAVAVLAAGRQPLLAGIRLTPMAPLAFRPLPGLAGACTGAGQSGYGTPRAVAPRCRFAPHWCR